MRAAASPLVLTVRLWQCRLAGVRNKRNGAFVAAITSHCLRCPVCPAGRFLLPSEGNLTMACARAARSR